MEQLQQGFSGMEKFMKIMEIEPSIIQKPDAVVERRYQG
jgi:hypothetical protein